jgi:hypothetical protein
MTPVSSALRQHIFNAMPNEEIRSLAAGLADAIYKRTAHSGPGPFKIARRSLYDFTSRGALRDSFIAELTAELLETHGVHMLASNAHFCFIHNSQLESWRTMPRRQLVKA